jgi:hypothetical protein
VVLTRNGRISHSELASKVLLSRNAVRQRIERLEREGHIAGYTIVRAGGDTGDVVAAWPASSDRLVRLVIRPARPQALEEPDGPSRQLPRPTYLADSESPGQRAGFLTCIFSVIAAGPPGGTLPRSDGQRGSSLPWREGPVHVA